MNNKNIYINIDKLFNFLPYIEKIRLSTISKKFEKKIFNIDPPYNLFDILYAKNDIEGLDFIMKNFYKIYGSKIITKKIIPQLIKQNKVHIFKWLIEYKKHKHKNDSELYYVVKKEFDKIENKIFMSYDMIDAISSYLEEDSNK
jgi:hypothetical protein